MGKRKAKEKEPEQAAFGDLTDFDMSELDDLFGVPETDGGTGDKTQTQPQTQPSANVSRFVPEPKHIFDSLGVDYRKGMAENIVFDIETAPLPFDEIKHLVEPFEPVPDFDPSTVKTGDCDRLKDKAEADRRKAEKISAARAEHKAKADGAMQAWADKITARSLLDPLIGRVIAVGYGCRIGSEEIIVIDGLRDEPEEAMVARFWAHYQWCRQNSGRIGGHNIRSFDVPWFMRRGMLHGIRYPETVISGRYLDKMFVDSSERWSCGMYDSKFVSANDLAGYFGTRRKRDSVVQGGTFHLYWKNDREKAIDYLTGDIECELDLCFKMGLWE